MLEKTKDFLCFFDFFGYNSFFYIAERKKYKTPLLGLVSLLIILFLLIVSIIKIINLFIDNSIDPNISYYKLINKENKIPLKAFPLIFQILTEETLTGESLDFYQSFSNFIYINNKKFEISHNLNKCKFYNLSAHEKPIVDFLNKTLFSDENFLENYFCLNLFNFKNNNNEDFDSLKHGKPLKIGFNYCILEEDCYERDVLSESVITFKLLNLEYLANLIDKKFLEYKINENIFTIKNKASIDLTMDRIVIKSYEDSIRINNGKEVVNDIYNVKIKLREKFTNEISLSNQNNKIIHDLELNLFLTDAIEFYTRTYENLFGILVQFGGFFSFVKFGIVFVHFFYEFYYCRLLFNFLFYEKKSKFELLQKNYFEKNIFKTEIGSYKSSKDIEKEVEFTTNPKKIIEYGEKAKIKHNSKLFENLFKQSNQEQENTINVDQSINYTGNKGRKRTNGNKNNKEDILLGTSNESIKNSGSKRKLFSIFSSIFKKGKEIKDEKYFIRRLFDMKNILLLVLTKFNLYDFYNNDRIQSENYCNFENSVSVQSNEKARCDFKSNLFDKVE